MQWFRTFLANREKHMTARETLSLSAWQKFTRFGRIPYKFILNLLLVICTTALIVMLNNYKAPYVRSNIQNWEYYLRPDDLDEVGSREFGYQTEYYIYRADTLVASLGKVRDAYFGIHNLSVDYYEHFFDRDGLVEPLRMSVRTYDEGMDIFDLNDRFHDDTTTRRYLLGGVHELPPFAAHQRNGTLGNFVRTIDGIDMRFRLKNYNIQSTRTCYAWSFHVSYDFGTRGHITQSIASSLRLCGTEDKVPWYQREPAPIVAMYFLTMIFAFVLQMLHFKAIARTLRIYQQVRIKHRGWNSLSCRDKLRFFNMWFVFATIGNVCNVVASAISLSSMVQLEDNSTVRLYFSGLGCMMAWISVVQYFESTTTYYVLVTTLTKGTPRVARFLVGVLPVFLGYAMFGVAFFSPTAYRFSTVDRACVTLFSLLNGDVIHDVFDELHPSHPYISRIYLYTFISLFIYAVLNIFIAIIEDAFFASKSFQQQQQKEFSSNYLDKMDPLDLLDLTLPPELQHQNSLDGAGHSSDPTSRQVTQILHASSSPVIQRGSSGFYSPRRVASPTHTLRSPLLSSEVPADGDSHGHSDDEHHEHTTLYVPPTPAALVAAPTYSSADPGLRHLLEMLAELHQEFAAEFHEEFATQLVNAAQLPVPVSRQRSNSLGSPSELLLADQAVSESEAPAAAVPATEDKRLDIPIRPPHDASYYPCAFPDCLYCAVRTVYLEGLARTKERLEQELTAFLDREDRAYHDMEIFPRKQGKQ